MIIRNLELSSFRNLGDGSIEFPPEGALFEGPNGAGKTNLLEAIHLLCTGKSQRGASRTEMIQFGRDCAHVQGEFELPEGNGERLRVAIGFDRDRRTVLRRHDMEVHSFSDWFQGRPVVSLGADDLALVYGPPDYRRRFLDLLCSQIDRDYLVRLLEYRSSLARRNRILVTTPFDRTQAEIYERMLAGAGAHLIHMRKETCARMAVFASEIYGQVSAGREVAQLRYEPSIKGDYSSKNEWENVFYTMLGERRNSDVEMGFSSIGPHRDDISMLLDRKPARTYGSQGQCRSLSLTLKLSSVMCIKQSYRGAIILLIDDAVSELDPERASRVYPLVERQGQVFIATPANTSPLRPELLRCTVSAGSVTVR